MALKALGGVAFSDIDERKLQQKNELRTHE